MTTKNDYPFAESPAAQMLADAIHRRQVEGISLRRTAAELNYRQAVVLSHMLTGRVPIPLERAPQFAKHLRMDEREFVSAVLRQRFPDIHWEDILAQPASSVRSGLAESLETIAGKTLDELSPQQQRVMREVVADSNADKRWLSVHEVPAIAMLRRALPDIQTDGMLASDMNAIEGLLDPDLNVELHTRKEIESQEPAT